MLEVAHQVVGVEAVGRLGQRLSSLGDQVAVGKPGLVAAEQLVDGSTLLGREHRLADAQSHVEGRVELALRLAAGHLEERLEALVGVGEAVLLTVPLLSSRWNSPRPGYG